MKNKPLLLYLPVLLSACAGTPGFQDRPVTQNDPGAVETKQSAYELGLLAIQTLREGKFNVDQAALEQGLIDGIAGKLPEIGGVEQQAATWQQLAKLNYRLSNNANLAAGKAFLEHNKTLAGVVSLPDGLQYEILKPGDGNTKPILTDTVGLLYKITGIDGTEKVNTMVKGKSVMYEIPLQKIASKGWQEAIQQMTEGSQWRLFIPGELAFGEKGLSEKGILPNETLVIETRLETITPAPK